MSVDYFGELDRARLARDELLRIADELRAGIIVPSPQLVGEPLDAAELGKIVGAATVIGALEAAATALAPILATDEEVRRQLGRMN